MPRHTPDEGGVIEFSVTDSGPGMREEVLARLYEAFFSTKAEGLGIGLPVPHRSSSRTTVGSRPRTSTMVEVHGCRFTFTLPVDRPPEADCPSRLPIPPIPKNHEPDPQERHCLRGR
jgi:signal transduction histidine kinase